MDSPPFFLTRDDVLEYHDEQIKLYGGLNGIGDSGLLDSAMAAPENLFSYDEEADLFDIATRYAFHISENQPFIDGNKRTGLQAAIGFLKGNDYAVETSEENLFGWMESLAKGEISREEFSRHLRACSVRERGLTKWLRTFFPV